MNTPNIDLLESNITCIGCQKLFNFSMRIPLNIPKCKHVFCKFCILKKVDLMKNEGYFRCDWKDCQNKIEFQKKNPALTIETFSRDQETFTNIKLFEENKKQSEEIEKIEKQKQQECELQKELFEKAESLEIEQLKKEESRMFELRQKELQLQRKKQEEHQLSNCEVHSEKKDLICLNSACKDRKAFCQTCSKTYRCHSNCDPDYFVNRKKMPLFQSTSISIDLSTLQAKLAKNIQENFEHLQTLTLEYLTSIQKTMVAKINPLLNFKIEEIELLNENLYTKFNPEANVYTVLLDQEDILLNLKNDVENLFDLNCETNIWKILKQEIINRFIYSGNEVLKNLEVNLNKDPLVEEKFKKIPEIGNVNRVNNSELDCTFNDLYSLLNKPEKNKIVEKKEVSKPNYDIKIIQNFETTFKIKAKDEIENEKDFPEHFLTKTEGSYAQINNNKANWKSEAHVLEKYEVQNNKNTSFISEHNKPVGNPKKAQKDSYLDDSKYKSEYFSDKDWKDDDFLPVKITDVFTESKNFYLTTVQKTSSTEIQQFSNNQQPQNLSSKNVLVQNYESTPPQNSNQNFKKIPQNVKTLNSGDLKLGPSKHPTSTWISNNFLSLSQSDQVIHLRYNPNENVPIGEYAVLFDAPVTNKTIVDVYIINLYDFDQFFQIGILTRTQKDILIQRKYASFSVNECLSFNGYSYSNRINGTCKATDKRHFKGLKNGSTVRMIVDNQKKKLQIFDSKNTNKNFDLYSNFNDFDEDIFVFLAINDAKTEAKVEINRE